MGFRSILWLYTVCTIHIQATTHWMVTENGLIQPKINSPYELAAPYDLLAFLNQDTRFNTIVDLYHTLSEKQKAINILWAKVIRHTDIANQFRLNDSCTKAGTLHIDWLLPHQEFGQSKESIASKEYLLKKPSPRQDVNVPDCKKISSLIFSMHAFDHLDSIIRRDKLSIYPEKFLPKQLEAIMTVDQFGHFLENVLRKNSSSWLHYNMASMYWRVRGNAPKALECSRRALHYVPRRYKSIALLNMGIILIRAKKTEDAITVLEATIDHDPTEAVTHFTLGNAYALIGNYNSSVKHFDQSIKLKPDTKYFGMYKYGALCHEFLWNRLKGLHTLLKNMRSELKDYGNTEGQWLKMQAIFLKTMKHEEEYDYRNVDTNCRKMTELTGLNIQGMKLEGDKKFMIEQLLESNSVNDEKWFGSSGAEHVKAAFKILHSFILETDNESKSSEFDIETNILHDGTVLKQFVRRGKDTIGRTTGSHHTEKSSSQTTNDYPDLETGDILYPPSMRVSRNTEDFDIDPDWPSERLCKETASGFPANVEAIFPVFLPFENKGIRLKFLLTYKIGVPANVEHELPWYPPTCPQHDDAAAFTQKKTHKQQIVVEVAATEHLRHKLLEYAGDGDTYAAEHMPDAELGHRVYAAMKMNLAPKWLMYTLASLYWRVQGNNINALHCLLSARLTVQSPYRDVVLTSLASVCLEMGYFEEAVLVAEEAYRLSLYEPATNFLLAELNMIRKLRSSQMFHLRQALRVAPQYMGGLARGLLVGWACLLNTMDTQDQSEGVCSQADKVCDKDGTGCVSSNLNCYSDGETSSIMLESKHKTSEEAKESQETKDNFSYNSKYTKDNKDNYAKDSPSDIHLEMFDKLTENTPDKKTDKEAHSENYETMKRNMDSTLKGCGSKGCSNIRPEDLAMTKEDCMHQHQQLGYWLHIASFRQLFSDSELELPSEILSMAASSKKIPECRLFVDPSEDFYLERLTNVDTEGWQPAVSLMHQFAEMLEFYDYVALGAKIAKYVNSRPNSWLGALGAAWWCGAGGRGECAARCVAAAYALAPPRHAVHAMRTLSALLHTQSKHRDAKEFAFLTFYKSPNSKVDAFLLALSHSYLGEYEEATFMYRYALTFDEQYLPAKACLHASMCLMLFGYKDSYFTED